MAITKTESDGQHPASHYLVVGDPEKVTTWHLRVKGADGKPNHGLMGAAKAALGGGYRGQQYDGPDKDAALAKLEAMYKAEGMKWTDAKLTQVRFVVDLSKVALSEAATGLTRTPIAAIGSWVKDGDSFSIGPADFQKIWLNFQKLGADGREKDDVVVDYSHATVYPELAQGGIAPAAGWLKAIVQPKPGDALLYGDIEFTDKARAMIAAKEIKYISPVICWSWPDKRTGEDQGPTITSLGLTNIPFLEELPALTMSDRGDKPAPPPGPQAAAPQAAAETPPPGGAPTKEKNMKKVKVSPIKSGENAGHLKISHPDLPADSDFYANKDDVAEALDDATAMDEKAGEKLSEATGLKGKKLSEQIPEIRTRFGQKPVLLSDLPTKADGPDKGAPDFAKFAPQPGQLVASEVFLAQAAEQVLDEAVRAKKILPKERPFLRKLALAELREYLAARSGSVALDTTEHGHGGTRGGDPQAAVEEHDAAVRKVLSEKRPGVKTYGDAMRMVQREQPDLRKAYDQAQGTRKSA